MMSIDTFKQTSGVKESINQHQSKVKNSLYPTVTSASVMAVAGMGDALLYVYLPVQGLELGMSALIIGVLLSINKFIRFFTNRWVAWMTNKWGIKNLMVFGVILAGLSTLSYAINPAILVWILTRIIWGFAFSTLRFSTIQFAGYTQNTGSALGIGRSIQELGPVLAYWIGPLLIHSVGDSITFFILGIATLACLPLLKFLPTLPHVGYQHIKAFKITTPRTTDIWVFLSSFLSEGLIIVGISKILNLDTTTDALLIFAALYISVRRFMNIIISPATGFIIKRIGFNKLFNLSSIIILAGLLIISLKYPGIGIVTVFFGYAINATLIPLIALNLSKKEEQFDVITRLSTSRDLGSALGALLGLSLLNLLDVQHLFVFSAAVMLPIWYSLRKLK